MYVCMHIFSDLHEVIDFHHLFKNLSEWNKWLLIVERHLDRISHCLMLMAECIYLPDRIYINTDRCCINTPLSWSIKMKARGACFEIKVHKGMNFNIRFKNMSIIAIQTFSLSASLQKDQCTLHTLNCKHNEQPRVYWLEHIYRCVLWLAFNPRDSGDLSDIYIFIYLQSGSPQIQCRKTS